jgi:hypothetical protein
MIINCNSEAMMNRKLGTKQTTLQLMRAARDDCAKVTIMRPRKTRRAPPHGTAKILPFTKSRAGG